METKENLKNETPSKVVKETKTPVQLPALPKKLLDAGLQTVLLNPRKAFIASGGTEQEFAKEINFAAHALASNDFLLKCATSNPENLIESIKNIALTKLSLNPVLKLGYLVPFKGKIQFMSSYAGKCEILHRSGMVKTIYAELVYENDVFEMSKGSDAYLKHTPTCWGNRGEIKGGYYFAELANGTKMFNTMSIERIHQIRAMSESFKSEKNSSSPWINHPEEMMRKTILNWAFKFLPKTGISENVLSALEIENKQTEEEFKEYKNKGDNFGSEFDEAEVIN